MLWESAQSQRQQGAVAHNLLESHHALELRLEVSLDLARQRALLLPRRRRGLRQAWGGVAVLALIVHPRGGRRDKRRVPPRGRSSAVACRLAQAGPEELPPRLAADLTVLVLVRLAHQAWVMREGGECTVVGLGGRAFTACPRSVGGGEGRKTRSQQPGRRGRGGQSHAGPGTR